MGCGWGCSSNTVTSFGGKRYCGDKLTTEAWVCRGGERFEAERGVSGDSPCKGGVCCGALVAA